MGVPLHIPFSGQFPSQVKRCQQTPRHRRSHPQPPKLVKTRRRQFRQTVEPARQNRRYSAVGDRFEKLRTHCNNGTNPSLNTKSTYVNRLRRAGVPREAAMRLVNHASDLVHQIYQREKVEDVVKWRDAVEFPQ